MSIIRRDVIKHQREIVGRLTQSQLLDLAMRHIADEANVDITAPGVNVFARLDEQGRGSLGSITHDCVVEITVTLP